MNHEFRSIRKQKRNTSRRESSPSVCVPKRPFWAIARMLLGRPDTGQLHHPWRLPAFGS